jgi:hypothetical protein
MVGVNFVTMLAYDPTYLSKKLGATGPPDWVYYTYTSLTFPAGLALRAATVGLQGSSSIRAWMRSTESRLAARAWPARLGRCLITVSASHLTQEGFLNDTSGCDAINTTVCCHF